MKTRSLAPLIVTALAGPVCAQVVEFIGNVAPGGAPPSLAKHAYESSAEIRCVPEAKGTVLPLNMPVNAVYTGLYDGPHTLTLSYIPAGTKVDSYLFHCDPLGEITTPGWTDSLILGGGVTFDRPILGVIVLDADLNASDAILGRPGTAYPIGDNRGMELQYLDSFTISEDRRTVSVVMQTDRALDQIRIITEAAGPVPAPATGVILAGAGLAASRRRR